MIQTFVEIDEAQTKLYERLLIERDTPQPVYCTQPDCSGFLGSMLQLLKRGNQNVKCTECAFYSCLKCLNSAHGGDCDVGELENIMNRFGIRRCPQCGQATMKNGGCSHMKCQGCGIDYTWQSDGGMVPWHEL